uniref:Uncharacterized protein n=1 Tax=Rhizophora mucronata TaxID=61149 RepID=A0A2P2QVC0_RHIMU
MSSSYGCILILE